MSASTVPLVANLRLDISLVASARLVFLPTERDTAAALLPAKENAGATAPPSIVLSINCFLFIELTESSTFTSRYKSCIAKS